MRGIVEIDVRETGLEVGDEMGLGKAGDYPDSCSMVTNRGE
jgi:hypothetical protein